jgi:hypothetical protein
LIIDGDKYDFVDNEEDREEVLNQISDKMKSTCLESYGVENPSQSPICKEKRKPRPFC